MEKENAVNNENAGKQGKGTNPIPVFPTKLRAKTEEFCNEFNTIQLLKKRSMTTGKTRKRLLEQEINARKQLLMVFQTQVVFLLDDAVEKTAHEFA